MLDPSGSARVSKPAASKPTRKARKPKKAGPDELTEADEQEADELDALFEMHRTPHNFGLYWK